VRSLHLARQLSSGSGSESVLYHAWPVRVAEAGCVCELSFGGNINASA
jgi:hypothetical protein